MEEGLEGHCSGEIRERHRLGLKAADNKLENYTQKRTIKENSSYNI